MLAGRLPFEGPTPQAAMMKRLAGPPAPLATVRADVPPHVADAVARMLDPDPAARPDTASAHADDVVARLPYGVVVVEPGGLVSASNPCAQGYLPELETGVAARCSEMLADALSGSPERVGVFRRDGWAKPWPSGPAMLAYMISHDAHHRGQVCMLAHQLGFPLPPKAAQRVWVWEKLWKECGFKHPR